jgi:predicted amidohydrolase
MDLAVEGKILRKAIDIDAFADASFSTEITGQDTGSGRFKASGYPDKITEGTKRILRTHVSVLEKYAENPIIINAVKERNTAGVTLDEIKAIDREWVGGGQEELVARLQKNPAGTFLREIILSNEQLYVEAFLCDKQGAVVGEYPKTTDYWQGDEKKFTGSYNEGNGKALIGPLEYDESTKSFSVKISVPVRDEGKTIGVLIFGMRNLR